MVAFLLYIYRYIYIYKSLFRSRLRSTNDIQAENQIRKGDSSHGKPQPNLQHSPSQMLIVDCEMPKQHTEVKILSLKEMYIYQNWFQLSTNGTPLSILN